MVRRFVIFWLKKLFRMPKPQLLVVGVVHQHQWLKGINATRLELEQREQFMGRMSRLIQSFRPTLVLDEIPDADNRALLEILPNRPIPIDIPVVQKLERAFNVERSMHFLCPYIDSIRERFWRYRLCQATKYLWNPRVLIFVGAKHLGSSEYKPLSFPDALRKVGYAVETVDLYNGEWDHSWVEDWRHPVAPVNWTYASQCCVRSGTFQRNHWHCDRKIYWRERFAQEGDNRDN
jgi:hypothetical protein